MGRHHDEDSDGVADQLDQQSRAYRENDNPTTDEEIAALGTPVFINSLSGLHSPAQYEASDWDFGREDPPVSI